MATQCVLVQGMAPSGMGIRQIGHSFISQISVLLLSLITDFFGFLLFFSLLSHMKKMILVHCFAIKGSMVSGDCLSLNNDNGNASLSRYVMLCQWVSDK